MKYGKHFIAASVATLMFGCSSESEPVPENQRPVINLTEGSSFDVNEGALVEVPFNVTDETAVSLSVTTNSGEIKGDVSLSNNLLSYTAPWVEGDSDIVETITLIAEDTEGLTSSATITFTIADGNTSATVVINPPSEAFGFEKTRQDTLLNFWIFEDTKGIVLSYDINDEDADDIALDYDVESENYLFRNQIEPSLNASGTRAELTFDLPPTDKPYEDVTVELTVDDGDDIRRVYAMMTVINQPDLSWNSPDNRVSEKSGGSLDFVMNESEDQEGTYTVEVTYPDGKPIDFDLPVTVNEDAERIEFGASEGFLGDRSIVVTLSYTMMIPNAVGEIYEHVTMLQYNVTAVDDRDDDFISINERVNELRLMYDQMTTRRDDKRVLTAFNDYLQFKGIISSKQSSTLNTIIVDTLEEEREATDAMFTDIEEALDAGANVNDITAMVNDLESAISFFGGGTRTAFRTAFNDMQTTGPSPIRIPDSTSGAELDTVWTSHYYGNSRYGSYENEQIDSFRFHPRYAYMNVTHISLSDCTIG